MVQAFRGVIGAGLMLGVAALPAQAQSLALPASDPVGIARSGAQVAYGYSLEAASANPALLVSLKETRGVYLAAGMDLASTQQSLESNQRSYFSSDRNRTLAAFGAAFRLSPTFSLGLKLDEPFSRHGSLRNDAPSRFLGDGMDLSVRRLEGQAAWALNPNVSVGLGLGVARLGFESTSVMRLGVAIDPTQPLSGANPAQGLVEQRVGQSSNKTVPSYSLGLRWAISTRWTMGATYQSGLKGEPAMTAGFRDTSLGFYGNDGLSAAPVGTAPRAATLLGVSRPVAGSGSLQLPAIATVGFRHRLSPMVTWEADLKWTAGGLRVPGFAQVTTPSGAASTPVELPEGRSHLGLGASVEVDLGKFWTVRGGLSLDQRSVEEARTEPLLGGARTAAFSIGAGYKTLGGELSLGYQYRQSEDQDTRTADGVWSSTGFRSTGTRLRLEGMGHLFALGFKKTF